MNAQTEIFPKSKEEQLKDWMKQQEFFATHHVIEFGLKIKYNRAIQTKGDFKAKGFIKELDEDEKLFRGFKSKESWYSWVGKR